MNATATPALDVTRFHMSLNVNDLSKAVDFLTALLGCPPKKYRADYAKFEPLDPPIVLSLEPRAEPQSPLRNTAGEGPLNHVGIRMTDAEQLVEVQRRLEAAGYSTQREEGVECCYARQTKFWVHDHDRTMWEVYVLDEDLEHRGGEQQATATTPERTCEPTQKRTWAHRLSADFPPIIPGAGELDEVALQGTWNAKQHESSWAQQLQQIRSALRPGGKVVLHMLTCNEPITDLQPLSGPASVVQVVPALNDVMTALTEAGFIYAQLLKYGSTPCFKQNGIELRETRLEAFTPCARSPLAQTVRVVYKGPLAKLVDDHGACFIRGHVTQVAATTWQRIASGRLADSFVRLSDGSVQHVACGTHAP